MAATPDNATFGANEGAATVTVADGEVVAILNDPTVVGAAAGARVVAFGLGTQSSMLGTVMTDAPFHFPEGGEKPEDVYLRFYALFETFDGTNILEKARFVGVYTVQPDDGELTTIGTHLNEYYENRDR